MPQTIFRSAIVIAQCKENLVWFTMPNEMELKQRRMKIFHIRYLVTLCLIALFIYWGTDAMIRYWSQPLTTDIDVKFGDTDKGIQFPLITVCNSYFWSENPLMKKCYDGSWHFIHSFISCMKDDTDFGIDTFMESVRIEIRDVVEKVRIWTGSEYIDLQLWYEHVWSMAFSDLLGPCFTFDLSKVDGFEYISLKERLRPGIEFILTENNPIKVATVLFHTQHDLPDAFQLNGHPVLLFSEKTKKQHSIDIRKRVNKREATRRVPCTQYERKTCKNIENNKLILEAYDCAIPILYGGQHLDYFIHKEISNCSNKVTLQALEWITNEKVNLNNKGNCTLMQTCKNTRFTSKHEIQETYVEKKTVVWIAFENPEVEYHNTYVSYGLISLIGEVGGILGLTLGASASTVLETLLQRIPHY